MLNILSLFHVYGLIIAIAIFVAHSIIEKKARQAGHVQLIESSFLTTVVLSIVGARLWHVLTSLSLYMDDPVKALYIWEGGLSIIGAFVGGAVAVLLLTKVHKISAFFLFDLVVFGIPFGQAIGRVANYVNNELYGLPTTLPWKIQIPLEYRLKQYQNFEYFHPLFLYEALLTLAFGVWVWWVGKNELIGKGWYFFLYLFYYSTVRFFLEFLRPDKALLIGSLGLNQCIVGAVAVVCIIKLKKMYEA